MIRDGLDVTTGEVITVKPYETERHLSIKKEVAKQIDYVNRTLKNDDGKIAKLDGDTLSMVLMEITAYYDWLYNWIAVERLHVDDMKTAFEIKFSQEYLKSKQEGQTNETARHLARIACKEDDEELNRQKYGLNVVTAWEKAIAKYIDSTRSQLSYLKFSGQFQN